MILLVLQIINVTVTYFTFSNVIKIDIKPYYEDLTLPAITFGLSIKQDLEERKYDEIFDKKCLDDFKSSGVNHTISEFFDCIHLNRETRKTLLQYPTYEEFDKCIKINLGNNVLNLTSNSKSFKSFDLRLLDNKYDENDKYPNKMLTFIFDQQINKMSNWNKFHQNFVTISYDSEAFRKLKFFKKFDTTTITTYVHSPQSPIITTNRVDIAHDKYYGYNNLSLMVHKNVRLNLGFPYGVCSHYSSQNTPFKAISQSDCLRKCSKTYFEKILKCSPLLTNGVISQLDQTETKTEYCSKQLNDIYHKIINNEEMIDKCNKLCPKDCVFIDFKITKSLVDPRIDRMPWYWLVTRWNASQILTTRLLWDMTSPMMYYIETPVMSFVEYLCYCGGLFGLWFASDGKLFLNFIPDQLRNKFSSLRRLFRNI